MVGHGAKLGRKKEQAIAALLTHRGIDEAATAVGIGTTTLRRWLRLPEFDAEFLQARREVVQQANARIQQYTTAAVGVLFKLMADAATPPAVKARVALGLVEAANKSLLVEDLIPRIMALEESKKNQP